MKNHEWTWSELALASLILWCVMGTILTIILAREGVR